MVHNEALNRGVGCTRNLRLKVDGRRPVNLDVMWQTRTSDEPLGSVY